MRTTRQKFNLILTLALWARGGADGDGNGPGDEDVCLQHKVTRK